MTAVRRFWALRSPGTNRLTSTKGSIFTASTSVVEPRGRGSCCADMICNEAPLSKIALELDHA